MEKLITVTKQKFNTCTETKIRVEKGIPAEELKIILKDIERASKFLG